MSNSTAHKRLAVLFDDGSFTELDARKTNNGTAVEVVGGFGTVNGCMAYAYAQEPDIDSGALSTAGCEKIKKIYSMATKTGCPVISVFDSNGIRLSEGFGVLGAYGEIIKASASVSGVCPQIAVVAGTCIGSSALIANLSDIVIAVKDAEYYIAPPADISAENCADEGTVDVLCNSFDEAADAARELISLLPSNNLSPAADFEFSAPECVADGSAESIIASIADADSVFEIKKSYANDCTAALATVNGSTAGFIGFDGGRLSVPACYKAEALIKLCDAYSLPIITVVNSSGLCGEKQNALLTALTKLTSAYSAATCPKVSLISGQAIGGAYLALAGKASNADLVFAVEGSVISPLDPDGAVAFFYSDRLAGGEDRDMLKNEYLASEASAEAAAKSGAVDDVIALADCRGVIINALDMLAGKRENALPRKHTVK